uniref:Cytochrome c oxidase subunit 2 n=1 Tax=Gordionus alpestris TaxID=1137640 RepID=A0A514ABW1_9BILA|nr:cytochrome c oxidase subunit II [Gordionus alpestris]QDH52411.1 cytochrome c oxidase subunit 2 [Gordionus alpestris]CAK6681846.1 CDS-2 [Gordionus sp. m RMFG-2023]
MNPWRALFLQDMLSSSSEHLIILHHFAMSFIVGVTIMVFFMCVAVTISKTFVIKTTHMNMTEFLWTTTPMVVLMAMALPTVKVLYSNEDSHWPDLTIKVMGSQWYWNYEYSDFMNLNFDSYMTQESDLTLNSQRLLDSDNHVIIPYKIMTRMMISSSDVIHSFSLPQFSVKMDAVPGRINQIFIMPKKPLITYGQCSEICGVNHSFMPICLEAVSTSNFINWINKQ